MPGNGSVCLLQDDEPMERLLTVILRLENIEAVPCRSGEALIETIEAQHPGAAIIDVGIPAEPSLALIQQVKGTSATPVLATSATGMDAVASASILAGADDYASKPFDPETLVDRVRFLLCRHEADAARTNILATKTRAEIDLANQRLTLRDNEMPISRTEWDILRALTTNAGQPVFITDIARAAFDRQFAQDGDYLRLWITRLQAKLGDNPDNPEVLRPFHEIGYTLAASPLPASD